MVYVHTQMGSLDSAYGADEAMQWGCIQYSTWLNNFIDESFDWNTDV